MISTRERRRLLDRLNRSATVDVAKLWAAARNYDDFAGFIVDGYPVVVDPWISFAADLAATWFEESVAATAVVAEPIPIERLAKSAQWALAAEGDAALARLYNTTQRAVFDGARNTTLVNVQRSGVRWAREPTSGNPCVFCMMLASRNTLYRSEDTAATEVHDNCSCMPIEVPDPGDYEPPENAKQWDDEYQKARAEAGTGKTRDILAAWRAQQPEYR